LDQQETFARQYPSLRPFVEHRMQSIVLALSKQKQHQVDDDNNVDDDGKHRDNFDNDDHTNSDSETNGSDGEETSSSMATVVERLDEMIQQQAVWKKFMTEIVRLLKESSLKSGSSHGDGSKSSHNKRSLVPASKPAPPDPFVTQDVNPFEDDDTVKRESRKSKRSKKDDEDRDCDIRDNDSDDADSDDVFTRKKTMKKKSNPVETKSEESKSEPKRRHTKINWSRITKQKKVKPDDTPKTFEMSYTPQTKSSSQRSDHSESDDSDSERPRK
jgi:hypothetical protein